MRSPFIPVRGALPQLVTRLAIQAYRRFNPELPLFGELPTFDPARIHQIIRDLKYLLMRLDACCRTNVSIRCRLWRDTTEIFKAPSEFVM